MRHVRFRRYDPSTIANGPEILGRVEAERGRVAHASTSVALIPRTVCLGTVLEYTQAMLARHRQDGVHARGLTVQMHRDQRASSGRDPLPHLFGVQAVC